MSVKVSALVWKMKLSLPEKLVLLRLADFADHDGGSIFPAVATVAQDCGISDRAVQRILKDSVSDGLLVIMGNETGGRGKSRHYAMDLDRAAELAGSGGEPERVKRANKAVTLNGHDKSAETVKRVTDEVTLSEPSKNNPTDERVTGKGEKGELGCHPTRQVTVEEDSGAGAPDAGASSAPLKSQLFGACLIWLATAVHKHPDKLRSLVGKWIAAHGEGAVLMAFVVAQREDAVEPIGFIEQVLGTGGNGKQRHGSKHDRLIHGLAGAFGDLLDPRPEDISGDSREVARRYH